MRRSAYRRVFTARVLVLVASISLVTAAVEPAEAREQFRPISMSAPLVAAPTAAAPRAPAPLPPAKPAPVKGDPAPGATAHGVAPATTAPAPAPTQPTAPAPPASPPVPTGYGCAAALAYLNANAAPGFIHECPGYAFGHAAMTCVNHAPECPGQKIIAINVPCPAAYMNEASNSWVLTGARNGSLDPYGTC